MDRLGLRSMMVAVAILSLVFGVASGYSDYTGQMTFTHGASCQELQGWARDDSTLEDRASACRTSAIAGGAASGALVCLAGLVVLAVLHRRTATAPQDSR